MPLRHTSGPRPYVRHPRDMTPAQRVKWMLSVEGLEQLEFDLLDTLNFREAIPNEWHEIWEGEDRDAKRTKVTIRLDADVVKFYKSLGPGYQDRINRTLRSYMQARLAKYIEGPEMERYSDEWSDAAR